MKNKIWIIAILSGLLLSHTACDDNKDEFLEDFKTILSIKNDGEVPFTLYKISGEDGIYKIIINKGGSSLNAVTYAEVAVMDKSTLDIYNLENGTNYVALPANTFEVDNKRIDFSRNDLYQPINVKFKTDLIYALPKIEGTYVVPIRLMESSDSINSKKRTVFIKPAVVVPSVFLDKNGYFYNALTDLSESSTLFKLAVTMPFTNKWAFDCSITIDQTLLDDYNKTSGNNYALLPAAAYTLTDKVTFTSKDDLKNFEINVSKAALSYGNYILPLRLNHCSKTDFVINDTRNTCLYGISYVPDVSKLKAVALKESMLTSNSPAAEGSIANLLDGDVATYFHSDYSGAVAPPHYLQVALGEEKTAFSFSFTARSSGGNGTPAQIDLYGSIDGTTFSKISTITEGLPPGGSAGAGKSYTSPVIVGKAFKYLRLSMPKNQSGEVYFVFSEFSMKAF